MKQIATTSTLGLRATASADETHTIPGLAAAIDEAVKRLATPGLRSSSADELLEKPETAKRLKISTRCLDQWMRAGRVPFLKIGKTVRFRWGDVVSHLTHNCRVN